jgi:MOSC domain-containing protein YiiM
MLEKHARIRRSGGKAELRANRVTVKQKSIGRVVAVSISDRKGVKKQNIAAGRLIENFGLESDAHAGDWHRQVSLLAVESIEKIRAKGLEVAPGDFAENITTAGIMLWHLPRGDASQAGA